MRVKREAGSVVSVVLDAAGDETAFLRLLEHGARKRPENLRKLGAEIAEELKAPTAAARTPSATPYIPEVAYTLSFGVELKCHVDGKYSVALRGEHFAVGVDHAENNRSAVATIRMAVGLLDDPLGCLPPVATADIEPRRWAVKVNPQALSKASPPQACGCSVPGQAPETAPE